MLIKAHAARELTDDEVLDPALAPFDRYRYRAFGARTDISGIAPARQDPSFQNRTYDAGLGIYDYRNRSFDPATGRFLQRDPVLDDANLYNPYAAMGNNPVTNMDPMGDKIFFEFVRDKGKDDQKDEDAPVGTIMMYNLLRYVPSDPKKLPPEKLKQIAEQHKRILEDCVNRGNGGKGYEYRDPKGQKWRVKMVVAIKTDQVPEITGKFSAEEHARRIVEDDAFSRITVLSEGRKDLHKTRVPAEFYPWMQSGRDIAKGTLFETVLTHELVGHWMGSSDEYFGLTMREIEANVRAELRDPGVLLETDSLMRCPAGPARLYPRHFKTAFEHFDYTKLFLANETAERDAYVKSRVKSQALEYGTPEIAASARYFAQPEHETLRSADVKHKEEVGRYMFAQIRSLTSVLAVEAAASTRAGEGRQ